MNGLRSVPRKGLIWLLALTLVAVAYVPVAMAGYKTYGDLVDGAVSAQDVTHLLLLTVAVAPGSEVMFVDTDTSGTVGSTEAVYLDLDDSGTVTALDVRIRSGSLTKGVFVKNADSDCCGTALAAAPGSWGFVDLYGFTDALTTFTVDPATEELISVAHGLSEGETVLVSTQGGTMAGGLTSGNVYYVRNPGADRFQVSATRAGSLAGISSTGTGTHSYQVTDGALNLGEPIYLDLDGSGTVTTLDIKVTAKSSPSAGGVPTAGGTATFANVAANDPDINGDLTALAGYGLNAFDSNGNGALDFSDTVYLDALDDFLPSPADLRLNKPASGSSFAAGTMNKAGDADTFYLLTALGTADLGFYDENVNGAVGSTEAIYIDMDGSGDVTLNDVRIAASGSTSLTGKQVIFGDSDLGNAITGLPGASAGFRFNDRNGNTIFDAEDSLYIDVNGGTNTVAAGDVRITKGTGSVSPGRVTSTSSDLNALLTDLAGFDISFFDVNGGAAYTRHDVTYLDATGDGLISPGDVLLSTGPSPFTAFGAVATDGRTELNYCYTLAFGAADIAFNDGSNVGVVDLLEMVYLDRAGTGTSLTGDVRLSTVTGGAGNAGTFVTSSANDNNRALTSTPGGIAWADSNGDGVYSVKGLDSVGDTLYIDSNNNNLVSVGDVRITKAATGTGAAGTKVAGNAPAGELNQVLTPLAGTFRAIDSNGDGVFTSADAVYYNADGVAEAAGPGFLCVTPGDIRLSGSASGGGGGGGGGSPPPPPPPADTTTTPPDTSTTTPTTDSTTTTTTTTDPMATTTATTPGDGTTSPDGTETGTETTGVPGFGLPLLVMGLGLVVFAVRRRLA